MAYSISTELLIYWPSMREYLKTQWSSGMFLSDELNVVSRDREHVREVAPNVLDSLRPRTRRLSDFSHRFKSWSFSFIPFFCWCANCLHVVSSDQRTCSYKSCHVFWVWVLLDWRRFHGALTLCWGPFRVFFSFHFYRIHFLLSSEDVSPKASARLHDGDEGFLVDVVFVRHNSCRTLDGLAGQWRYWLVFKKKASNDILFDWYTTWSPRMVNALFFC